MFCKTYYTLQIWPHTFFFFNFQNFKFLSGRRYKFQQTYSLTISQCIRGLAKSSKYEVFRKWFHGLKLFLEKKTLKVT